MRALAALALLVWAFLAPLTAAPASAAPLPVTTCAGVWVVVGPSVRCATDHSDGLAALRSAGFSVETTNGLVCRIGGSPAACTANFSAYWSYWHAARNADGSYGPWSYSAKGATQYHPAQGDAEGWAFGDGTTAPSGRPGEATGSTETVASASALPTDSQPPAPAESTATVDSSGPSGPATAAYVLGALALGGVGVAWGVRRRPTL